MDKVREAAEDVVETMCKIAGGHYKSFNETVRNYGVVEAGCLLALRIALRDSSDEYV